MSEAQEYIGIYLWGFIESRGGIPSLVEAYGDLTGEIAAMNATERALEMGFSGREASNLESVLVGSDDAGSFEVRQFWMEEVSVNGAHVLFEEANDLAEAVAKLLSAVASAKEHVEESAFEEVRRRLALYNDRWQIDLA